MTNQAEVYVPDTMDFACALPVQPASAVEPTAQPVDQNAFVQPVPNHCDRITWRNRYYHLPIKLAATPPPVAGDAEDARRYRYMRNIDAIDAAVSYEDLCKVLAIAAGGIKK